MRFEFFVFSFNRGEFLLNCLSSIERFSEGTSITIIDDSSNDPQTLSVLDEASKRMDVTRPPVAAPGEYKTGGLYQNMNFALNRAVEKKVDYAVFIQDDMQVVRQFTNSDKYLIKSFLDANQQCIQLQTCFRRRNWPERAKLASKLDMTKSGYMLVDEAEQGKDNFSAVGVFDVRRTRKMLTRFLVGERANSDRCRSLNIKQGIAAYPFMNWLPYPSSFRGKRRSLQHRLVEALSGAGFHPIAPMPKEVVDSLLGRDPFILPIAEEWLRAPSAPRHDFWSTGGGKLNLYTRGGAPLLAYKAARWVKNLKTM